MLRHVMSGGLELGDEDDGTEDLLLDEMELLLELEEGGRDEVREEVLELLGAEEFCPPLIERPHTSWLPTSEKTPK